MLETGIGARRQPLMLGITTAGVNQESICRDLKTYAEKLKACGHQDRIRILKLLYKKERSVLEMVQKLNILQPVVSQHLAVLRMTNVVESEIRANQRIYSIKDMAIQDLIAWV